MGKPIIAVDPTKSLKNWLIFPDVLPNGRFRGFENRDDASLLRGAWVIGQNVTFARTAMPSPRSGYEPIGAEATDATPVQRAWVVETPNGDVFELKAYDTKVMYWLWGVSTEYALLKGGFTAGLEFTFGNIGETGQQFHDYFCNGTDDWYRFNGAFGTIASVTAATLTLAGGGTWTASGFYSTGTRSVIINGVEYTYTGGEGTDTLTGVTPNPTGLVNAGDLVVQSPQAVSSMANYKSSVAMAHDFRIHARLETNKSTWNYSKLGDPEDFTTGSLDGDGGSKNVEFSGPILAFLKLNKTIIAGKRNMLKLLQFTQSGDRIDVPYYETLVQVDDKSSSLGVTNQKSTFSTPLGAVFVTQDKRMMLLTGVTANDQPQWVPLSDPIQPIFSAGDHTDGTGICVDNLLFYAFKSSSLSQVNDVVVVGDMTKKNFDVTGQVIPIQWDAPYVGWNVKDWTAIFNPEEGRNEVHFHSSINSSSYRVILDKLDNTNSYTTIIRSWQETFDLPHTQKNADFIFLDMRMTEITEITFNVYYDDNGASGIGTYTLNGDNAAYRFGSNSVNPFGASPFGTQKFGSNESLQGASVYRFFVELPGNVDFFNMSIELITDGAAMDYELVRFGVRLNKTFQEPPTNLKVGA